MFHIRFIDLFSKDLIEGIRIYGYEEYIVRNSPILYILSQLNKLVSLETIRLINSISPLLLVIIFYRCLKIKFKTTNNEILKILSCIIFLSPTVRSHAIWPPNFIMWGLIFFTISVYYFLKFKNIKIRENKYFYISIIFLVISSYIHISFSVFIIYYFIYFLKNNRFNFSFIKFTLFVFIISIPAIWFVFF